MMQRALVIVIGLQLFCSLQLFTLGSTSPIRDAQPMPGNGGIDRSLKSVNVRPNEIEGEYRDGDGGIYFRSSVDSNFYYIHITTTNGEPLFAFKRPRTLNASAVCFVSILGEEFAMTSNYSNGSISGIIYRVSEDCKQLIKDAIDQEVFQGDLLQCLEHENATKKESIALKSLLSRPEIKLIRAAAIALEKSGVEGSENLAAMNFYDMALKLKMAKSELKYYEDKARVDRELVDHEVQKRQRQFDIFPEDLLPPEPRPICEDFIIFDRVVVLIVVTVCYC